MAFRDYNYYVLIFQGCAGQSGSLVGKASSTSAHYPPSELSNLLQGQRRGENDTMLILSWLFLVLMCVINNTLIILLTFSHFCSLLLVSSPFQCNKHSPYRSAKWKCFNRVAFYSDVQAMRFIFVLELQSFVLRIMYLSHVYLCMGLRYHSSICKMGKTSRMRWVCGSHHYHCQGYIP